MDPEFEIIEKTIGPVIEIEERVSMWRMPATFTRDYKRIADYLRTQDAECVDMPYARYQDMDWERELNQGKLAAFLSSSASALTMRAVSLPPGTQRFNRSSVFRTSALE